ncbi:MAG: hypothetical protein WD749_13270, partial [Phycisphaerales bacterium]
MMATIKCRRSVGLAAAAGTTLFIFGGAATAQTVVYDNTTTTTGASTPEATPAGSATGVEVGDQITLAGTDRAVTQFEVSYNVSTAAAGATTSLRFRFYQMDGPGGAPGTVLWDSGNVTGYAFVTGPNIWTVPVPNVAVPDTFIYSVQVVNRTDATGSAGPRLFNPPTVGTSGDFFWADSILPQFPGWTPLFYNGNPVANYYAKATAVQAITGACCLPTGACETRTILNCNAGGGVYGGDNQPCGVCDTGRCCLADGTCRILTQHGCTLNGGTYGGNSSTCTAACPTPPPVLFNNGDPNPPADPVGTIITGTTTASSVQAPPGTNWSELQVNAAGTCANNITGFGNSGAIRLADDMTIPAPGWNIQQIVVYPIIPNGNPDVSNITSANLRIWDGPPNNPGSTVVFGDTTTNRLHSAHFASIYRIGATVPPANAVPVLTRPVYRVAINVNATLGPGTYWMDYNLGGMSSFNVPVTIVGVQQAPGANALQFFNNAWNAILDTGNPANCHAPGLGQDASFIVLGTVGAPATCYANCDNSTQPPVLNVADFGCFLTRYAAGESYANCDASTQPPVLNVAD